MDYTHLHVHTEYSLLDGSNKIKEYVKRVKELGMNSAAITDHGVMYGVIDFYRCAKAEGIKPIIGSEVYVAPNTRFDREGTGGEERYYHLVLLAKNNVGYQNLMKIVSIGFTEGFYYRPRVDMEILNKYHEGIIALSACLAGELPRVLMKAGYEEGVKVAKKYLNCFGEGNYYLELQDHGMPEQRKVNMELIKLSEDLGIPMVATNDIHYTYSEDPSSHDILLCIQTGKKLTDEDRMRYPGGQFYVKSPKEMEELFPYALHALENTKKIADMCNVEIEFGNHHLPRYDVPKGYNSKEYLRYLCMEGFAIRYPDRPQELEARLTMELDTIYSMGFTDYFLIVWDFINYSRSNDIPVGPGRGSAAGSMVSYCLRITNVDPIKYNLLFERFLNPERISMPDIDIDFCFERRQEVIDYVAGKYGSDKVVQIITFGTLAARGVIRDVGRVMDLPYTFVDKIAKMIPTELNITLDKAINMNPELSTLIKNDDSVEMLIKQARRLEGLPRHSSTHAAGVVICPEEADRFVPLSRGTDGAVTTQFTMVTLEELGLLKMDFLGLRTLTVIKTAIDIISATKGIEINLDTIDYDDKAVYESIASGKNDGVFQLESAGMKSFMKELKPACLEDVIAGISLYRPGPMDFIPKYIKGKCNPDNIRYHVPELEVILAPTYGCIVYQEQVMQIVRDLGGYTLGRSDLVRRAMSKKKTDVMERERKVFIYGDKNSGVDGCVAKGIPEDKAGIIFDEMIDFAKYAFNKSHAAGYAIIAYQTAYLKYYYPVEFMAALLTSVMDKISKVSEYILVASTMGIKVLPPDVNKGFGAFGVENDSIRYALTAIKGVGRHIIDAIVSERKRSGEYKDIKDFLARNLGNDINKRVVESFIKAGALDSLGANRRQLMFAYVDILDGLSRDKKNILSGQMSFFDVVSDEHKSDYEVSMPDVDEYTKEELLVFEKEVMGIYISGHPIEDYEDMWRKRITQTASEFALDDETQTSVVIDDNIATIGGIITSKTIKYTKNNQIMAFITVEDLTGTVEVIIFPKVFDKYSLILEDDSKVFIHGRISKEDNKDSKLIAQTILSFDDVEKTLWIQFDSEEKYSSVRENLHVTLRSYYGKDSIKIYIKDEKKIINLSPTIKVNAGKDLRDILIDTYDEENIRIT